MDVTVAMTVTLAAPGLFGGAPSVALSPEALGLAGVIAGMAPAIFGINLLGDDEEDTGEDDGDGDAVFDDDGDDLGGLDALDDEGFEGFDDDDDGLGGGADGDVGELENRLEELENEVASLSSSVNTVETENEAISETVDEIEENVRDLLEIYEMVTRGVNPFVDEAAGGAMGGPGDDGGFGLFDGGDDDEGDVDDSIADADAEEFFDDDFDDPGDDLADPDEVAVTEDDGGLDDDLGGMDGLDGDDGGDGDGDDGKSFEELKQEYESGEAGWDVDDPLDGDADEAEADGASDADADDGGVVDPGDDLTVEEGAADAPEEPAGDGIEDGRESPPEAGPGESDDPDAAFEFVGEQGSPGEAEGDEDDRLHLREFPDGYLADLTALEWLEFLIDVGGTNGARAALGYYVDVGWISPGVEDDLHAFLDGLRVSGVDGGAPGTGGLAEFDPEHHRRSLAYVARLAGDGDRGAVLDRIDTSAGIDPLDASAPAANPVADGGEPDAGGDDDGL